jgi:phage shock protein A
MPVAKVETSVLDNYATVMLSTELRARIAARVEDVLSHSESTHAAMAQRMRDKVAELNAREDGFLDLVGDPDWPQEKIAQRLRTIRDERNRLAR